jgi:hypothetical protein
VAPTTIPTIATISRGHAINGMGNTAIVHSLRSTADAAVAGPGLDCQGDQGLTVV